MLQTHTQKLSELCTTLFPDAIPDYNYTIHIIARRLRPCNRQSDTFAARAFEQSKDLCEIFRATSLVRQRPGQQETGNFKVKATSFMRVQAWRLPARDCVLSFRRHRRKAASRPMHSQRYQDTHGGHCQRTRPHRGRCNVHANTGTR